MALTELVSTAILLTVLIAPQVRRAEASIDRSSRFVRSDRCPGMVLSSGHSYFTARGRSALECVTLCALRSTCLSTTFDARSFVCRLGLQAARLDCSNMETASQGSKHFELRPACTADFQRLGPAGSCVCVEGYRGDPCAPYVGDCADAFNKGLYNDSAVLPVHPLLADKPFPVSCKARSNLRTYIMDRNSNLLPFNRTFSDYQRGFGDPAGDHWLGLEKIYQLTNSKAYELRVVVTLQNKTTYFQQYQDFNISDAASGYRLYFNRNVTTYMLGDCFSPLMGAAFSAYDSDNDGDPKVNCALRHAAGFWFSGRNCSTCNPMGPLPQPASGIRLGIDSETFWTFDLGKAAVFKINMFLVVL